MNFIVVGCGRVGAEVTRRLNEGGHSVAIIDRNKAAFEKLSENFVGRTIHGDALAQDVLERAGIREAHGLATVTNSDTLNIVVAHAARQIYHVPIVVCRNYDPRRRAMLEAFGIQIVSSAAWGAQRIEELLLTVPWRAVFSTGNGEVEIYELLIPPAWHGCTWSDLCTGNPAILPVAVTRSGQAMIVSPTLKFQAGDLLTVSATFEGIKLLRNRLESGKER